MYFHMLVQVRFSFEKFFTSLTLKSRIFEVCRVLRLRLNQILLYFGLNQILCVNNRGYLLFSWTFLNSVMNRTFISNQLFTILFLQFLISNKVENILKGSLDLIPSPSVKIDIMGGKVCLRCKGKTLLGDVNKLLKTKSFFDISQQCFALLPNFPTNNLNFHWRWRWWDQIFSVEILVCCNIFGPIRKNWDWEFRICKIMFWKLIAMRNLGGSS